MFEENGRLQARLLGREHPLHLRYPTGSAEISLARRIWRKLERQKR
jgi:hypothetical protein